MKRINESRILPIEFPSFAIEDSTLLDRLEDRTLEAFRLLCASALKSIATPQQPAHNQPARLKAR